MEAVFDVEGSAALSAEQKARVRARCGPRITAIAQDTRSQTRNRELALARLRERLERALVVQRKRRPTRPTKASKVRRLEGKRHAGERKAARRRPRADE